MVNQFQDVMLGTNIDVALNGISTPTQSNAGSIKSLMVKVLCVLLSEKRRGKLYWVCKLNKKIIKRIFWSWVKIMWADDPHSILSKTVHVNNLAMHPSCLVYEAWEVIIFLVLTPFSTSCHQLSLAPHPRLRWYIFCWGLQCQCRLWDLTDHSFIFL